MKVSQTLICFICQDLIGKEKCFICKKDNNLCKRCLDEIITKYFNQPSVLQVKFDDINLEWIKILKSELKFCKGCADIGLNLNPEVDIIPLESSFGKIKNLKISSITFRIYLLIKRSKKDNKDKIKKI
jgi:hypothetical protein